MSEPNISLEAQGTSPRSEVERRARVRYSANQETLCHLIAAEMHDTWWQARIENFSARGLGLFSTYQLEAGTLLAVDLEGASRLLLARVTHVTPHAEGWFAGCELVSKLSSEELQILL
jgi:hypothetical protein